MYRCPICGKPTEYKEELGGLCEECYKKKIRPKTYEIKTHEKILVCRDCFAIRIGNEWVQPKPKYLKSILSRIAKKTFKGYTPKITKEIAEAIIPLLSSEGEIRIPITLVKENIELGNYTMIVKVKHTTCPICVAKKTGGYWTFIAHIRAISARGRKSMKQIEHWIYEIIPDADVKRLKNGFDIRSSDSRAGARFVNKMQELGALVKKYVQRKKIMKGKHEVVINKFLIQI